MWLRVKRNNGAATVLSCFLEATEEYGLPQRVPCDNGGENVEVVYRMIELQ